MKLIALVIILLLGTAEAAPRQKYSLIIDDQAWGDPTGLTLWYSYYLKQLGVKRARIKSIRVSALIATIDSLDSQIKREYLDLAKTEIEARYKRLKKGKKVILTYPQLINGKIYFSGIANGGSGWFGCNIGDTAIVWCGQFAGDGLYMEPICAGVAAHETGHENGLQHVESETLMNINAGAIIAKQRREVDPTAILAWDRESLEQFKKCNRG